MNKRVKLLRSVLSFNMKRLTDAQVYHKEFKSIAKTVTSLTNRVRKAGRKKVDVCQLEFVEQYQARFRRHRRKKVTVEIIDAIDIRNARKILRDKHGKKIKILTVKIK